MSRLNRNWLHAVPWASVVAINAALCETRNALHKPTSDGYVPAKDLWERSRKKELPLTELLHLGYQCHRLAPFCNYNGNTFVTIVKTLLDSELKRLPADKAFILRSVAGHIVAGTATEIERKQLDEIIAAVEK